MSNLQSQPVLWRRNVFRMSTPRTDYITHQPHMDWSHIPDHKHLFLFAFVCLFVSSSPCCVKSKACFCLFMFRFMLRLILIAFPSWSIACITSTYLMWQKAWAYHMDAVEFFRVQKALLKKEVQIGQGHLGIAWCLEPLWRFFEGGAPNQARAISKKRKWEAVDRGDRGRRQAHEGKSQEGEEEGLLIQLETSSTLPAAQSTALPWALPCLSALHRKSPCHPAPLGHRFASLLHHRHHSTSFLGSRYCSASLLCLGHHYSAFLYRCAASPFCYAANITLPSCFV